MAEYNPPALAYRQRNAESEAAGLSNSLLTPLRFHNERKQHADEVAYRNREADRADRRDTNADERDRIAERDRVMAGTRSDQRERERNASYEKGQSRLAEQGMFERKRLIQAEHEALIRELYEAINSPGQDSVTRQNRIKAAQDGLERAGYGVAVNEDTPNGPTLPSPIQEAPPPAVAPAPKQHLSAADTSATSAALDKAGRDIPATLAGGKKTAMPKTKAPPGGDAGISSALDAADQTYSKGLGVAPWLPGQSPVGRSRAPTPSVVQSDAMLDPDDPYNNIVK